MKEKRKPIRKTTGFIFRSYIPIKDAIGAEKYRESFAQVGGMVKAVFKRSRALNPETFAEALARQSISEEDLALRYKNFQTLFYVFFTCALLLFFYSFYMLFAGYFFSFILGLAVTTLAGVQAFKRHFWMFQVRQRRLGCTFREWWQDLTSN